MCIFCDIAAGKIPSSKVYEDDQCVAILDLSQVTEGHTLVMPKKHVENLISCDDETLAHLMQVTKKIAALLMEKLGATGVNIINNCNPVAGQSVMHLHFHIIPRYSEKDSISTAFENKEKINLDKVMEKLR